MSEHDHDHHSSTTHGSGGYDKSDVNVKMVFWISVIVLGAIAVSLLLLNDWFVLTKEHIIYEQVLRPESIPLRELRAREDQVINSYKVIDSARGIYQIPIEKAMELTADEAYQRQATK